MGLPSFAELWTEGTIGAQCATDVRQSHYGKCRVKGFVCGYWLGAPGEIENALEQVEDTVGEHCGRSTDANVKNIDFCGRETVETLVLLRKGRQCTGK